MMNLRQQFSDTRVLAKRNLAHVRQVPERLMEVTAQPLMFVLLFAFVFGGAIKVPGGHYREYMLPGIIVQTLAFAIIGPATALATDLTKGIIDRFRSLPMSRAAFLYGHLLAGFLSALVAVAVLCVGGLAVGWGIHSDFVSALAGFGLLFLFIFTMLWVALLIGTLVRSPEAVAGIALTVMFPLTFLASSFVPVHTLPTGLREVAHFNPLSAVSTALRSLFGNPTGVTPDAPWPLHHPILTVLIWCVGILLVVVPLTIRRYSAKMAAS